MIARLLLQTAISLAVQAAILMAAAGDWGWAAGWLYLAEVAILSVAVAFGLLAKDPDLLAQRMSNPFRRKDQRPFDRMVIVVTGLAYLGWLVLMGLDAVRFRWAPLPLPVQALGAVLLALAMGLVWIVFRANSFAVPQVRVQAERAQTVVDTGPYGLVRHPMYAGALLFFVASAAMLGSGWGLAGAAALTVGLAVRALGEEAVLQKDLPGYAAYMQKVRWRLIPGLW
jgi:protein-S-isoprenylcysteine O-methyltransferase Ste14